MSVVSPMISSHGNGYGVLNPSALTDAEFKNFLKALNFMKDNPLTLENFHEVFEPQVGYKFTVPFSALHYAWENEDFTQNAVSPALVLKLLLDPLDGLLLGHKLSRLIEFGYRTDNLDSENNPIDPNEGVNTGGRHRQVTLSSWLVYSELLKQNIDPLKLSESELKAFVVKFLESDEVQNLRVPVQPVLYSLGAIRRSNLSRRMDGAENTLLKIQVQGTGLSLLEIAKGINSKAVKPAEGWKAMFALLGDSSDDLTVLAASQLGGKVYTFLKQNKFSFPAHAENMVKLVQSLWDRVPLEVQNLKDKNITNIARNGLPVIAANLNGYASTNKSKLWLTEEQLAEASANKGKKSTASKPATTAKAKTTSAKTPAKGVGVLSDA